MAIAYSGSTIIDTTFTGATRADIASNIITQLLAAGWTNVSGSGTDQVLKCAATATGTTGLQIAVRVYDPGSGNCARVALRNVSGSRVGIDLYLLPAASKTFRIIANKYQFWCFTPGVSAVREFVCVSQLIVPSWLSASIVTNCAVACGNANSDSDTTYRSSWRTCLGMGSTANGGNLLTGRMGVLSNDTMVEWNNHNAQTFAGWPRISALAADPVSSWGYQWIDGTLNNNDPLVATATTSPIDEPKYIGQLSDAVVISSPFAIDSTFSLDGHTWRVINSFAGAGSASSYNGAMRGSLAIAVA